MFFFFFFVVICSERSGNDKSGVLFFWSFVSSWLDWWMLGGFSCGGNGSNVSTFSLGLELKAKGCALFSAN